MANERFKAKLAALDGVRREDGPSARNTVRRGLADRNGFIIAKAATAAAGAGFDDVLPDLERAFERLLEAVDDDPGCRAKDALAKAMRDLGERSPDPFVAGLAHVQLEPVWGGRADTAGPLRATCARALIACDLDPAILLELLVDHLVDADKWVRSDVAATIAQLGRPESVLLLRLKALAGDAEAEVVGACLSALLEIEPERSVPFVARFLEQQDDDVRLEAVSALAQAKAPHAFAALAEIWSHDRTAPLRRPIIAMLAGCPQRDAAIFLATLVETSDDDEAAEAIDALALSRFALQMRERVATAAGRRSGERIRKAFERGFAHRPAT